MNGGHVVVSFDNTATFSVMKIVAFALESPFGDLVVQYFQSAADIAIRILVQCVG